MPACKSVFRVHAKWLDEALAEGMGWRTLLLKVLLQKRRRKKKRPQRLEHLRLLVDQREEPGIEHRVDWNESRC